LLNVFYSSLMLRLNRLERFSLSNHFSSFRNLPLRVVPEGALMYLRGAPESAPVLRINMGLGQLCLAETNALAYFAEVTKKKRVHSAGSRPDPATSRPSSTGRTASTASTRTTKTILNIPGVHFIKLFSAVIYDFRNKLECLSFA
jgi:hypothetical protein